MNNEKTITILKSLLIGLVNSGFLEQNTREGSILFKVIENDKESLEWFLENIPLEKSAWKDMVQARRKLLNQLGSYDYSYEFGLLKSYVSRDPNKEFLEEHGEGFQSLLSKYSDKKFVGAREIEEIFRGYESLGDIFKHMIDFNKNDIVELSNLVDDKIQELYVEKRKNGQTIYSEPSNFYYDFIVKQDWYAQNKFDRGDIDLRHNIVSPKNIEDIDYLKEAIKQNYNNYEYINDSFKKNKEILEVLADILEKGINDLMTDVINPSQLHVRGMMDISKWLAASFDDLKKHEVDEDFKTRCVSLGVPVKNKWLKDNETAQIIAVNNSLYEKFKENKSNKMLLQSEAKLCDYFFKNENCYSGVLDYASLLDIFQKNVLTTVFLEKNKNSKLIPEHKTYISSLIDLLKEEMKKNENLKKFVMENPAYVWKDIVSGACSYQKLTDFIDATFPEIEKLIMKQEVLETPSIENKVKAIKKF